MVVDIRVHSPILRGGICVIAFVGFGMMLTIGLRQFVVGTLSDRRLGYQDGASEPRTADPSVNTATISEGLDRYPNSSRLHYRLAEAQVFEAGRGDDMAAHALEAVRLSPYDYKLRELLASIQESQGYRFDAEQSLRTAVSLAPNYADVHWRLANLLLRQGKLDESTAEFLKAGRQDDQLLPNTLDLLWRASKGDVSKLRPLVNDDHARLDFAQFLLQRQHAEDAVEVLGEAGRTAKLASSQTSEVLNALIAQGRFDLAKRAWVGLVADDSNKASDDSTIWNGGFETDILLNHTQFDWSIAASDYARISIDGNVAHNGKRSLRIDFSGRDTTRLDSEIKQLVVVKPATRYRLLWFVRTDGLVTPKGPRVEVSPASGAGNTVLSEAVASGSNDWREMSLDFTTPASAMGSTAIYLSIVRRPEFSYDDPTIGTVRFDDFTITELKTSR